jgi:hypothetical protein
MYVPLEEAREIIRKRWHDSALRRQVADYVGEIPAFLRDRPRAVLARHVATPNFDFIRFSEAAKNVDLEPVCPEYTGDKFCTLNRDKLLLGAMTFFQGINKAGKEISVSCKVVDFMRFDGKPFTSIETLWGEDFLGFHHRLLRTLLPEIEITDNTEWLTAMGGKPALFWPRLFALFICGGILFENFHGEGREAEFTRLIIRPAVEEVKERFGLSPLVVPLVPVEEERQPFWSWYPGQLEAEVKCRLAQCDPSAIPHGGQLQKQDGRWSPTGKEGFFT